MLSHGNLTSCALTASKKSEWEQGDLYLSFLPLSHVTARHVDYIHINPVRHGRAAKASDWPWSSIHRYIRHGMLAAGLGDRTGPAGLSGRAARVMLGFA